MSRLILKLSTTKIFHVEPVKKPILLRIRTIFSNVTCKRMKLGTKWLLSMMFFGSIEKQKTVGLP
jgi:hypothetical protein